MKRDFLKLTDLSSEELNFIIDKSIKIKKEPNFWIKYPLIKINNHSL